MAMAGTVRGSELLLGYAIGLPAIGRGPEL